MGYNVYQDDELIAENIEEKEYTVEGLEPSTEYSFGVSQVIDGKESEKATVSVRTKPKVTTDEITEEIDIVEYDTVRNETDELPKGEEEVVQEGKNGYTKVTYKVTYEDGVEVDREETNREVIDPVDEIINVGTYEEPEPEPEPDPEEGD